MNGERDAMATRLGEVLGDRTAKVLGQGESVLMSLAVPVRQLALHAVGDEPVDGLGVLAPRIDLLAGQDEAPRCPEAGNERLVAGNDRENFAKRPVDRGEESLFTDLRHPRLHGEDAAGCEAVVDDPVELPAVEQAGRALLQRLDEIADDQVEAIAGPLEVGAGVFMA